MSAAGAQHSVAWEAEMAPHPGEHPELFWRSLFYFNVYRLLVALLLLLSVAIWGPNLWFGSRDLRLFAGTGVAYGVFRNACFNLIRQKNRRQNTK